MAFRPGNDDTEEDLLEAQNEFLAGRLRPAAAAVRVKKEGANEEEKSTSGRDVVRLDGFPSHLPSDSTLSPPKRKSKFKERTQKTRTKRDLDENADPEELLDRHDTHISTVLSQIKERDTEALPVLMPLVSERGFPTVLHRGDIIEPSSDKDHIRKPGRSLFAQQFAQSGGAVFGIPNHKPKTLNVEACHAEDMDLDTGKASVFSEQVSSSGHTMLPSSLITGHGLTTRDAVDQAGKDEVLKIHKENTEKLSAMSKQEILEEQAKLKATLDPRLLAFLQTRKKKGFLNDGNAQNDEDMEESTQGLKSSDGEVGNTDAMAKSKRVHFDEDVSMAEFKKEENFVQQLDDGTWKVGDVKLGKNLPLHMDKVEEEKLEWTKDCPPPSVVEIKQGNQARFDFEGNLVSRVSDVPVHLGLHHHGDEPEAAGYTLQELFLLSRSNFLQQRVLALQVLAKILQQERLGRFESTLETPLLPVLLESGLIFLLRWALDDSSDAVMAAAVQGLAAVLVVPLDKELEERCCVTYRGLELPSLQPLSDEKPDKKAGDKRKHRADEEDEDHSDAEVLKRDVAKGLLQMRLLPRLRYVLEVCRPAAPVVLSILAILCRVAQHSTAAAHEIVRCPRLLDTVVSQFLPLSWKPVTAEVTTADLYGTPVCGALKLLRSICSAGKHMATSLISKHGLMERILRYTALHPRDLGLELRAAYQLSTESLLTWRVCLSYGQAGDAFRETYIAFVQHLQSIQHFPRAEQLEIARSCAALGVIDAAVHVAGTATEMRAKMSARPPEEAARNAGERDAIPRPPLDWSHVTGLSPLIGGCVMKIGGEILTRSRRQLEEGDLILASNVFNLLASFYSKLPVQPSFSPVEDLEAIERLVTDVLHPLGASSILTKLLHELQDCSLSSGASKKSPHCTPRDTPNLPSYGCESSRQFLDQKWKSAIGSVAFMTSALRLITEVIHVHKGMANKFVPLVCNSVVLDYLKFITESEVESSCFFIRAELHLQYFLVKLFHQVAQGCDEKQLDSAFSVYHRASLALFTRLKPGDEYYAHDLVSAILFNGRFFPEAKELAAGGVTSNLSQLSIQSEARPTPSQASSDEAVARNRGVLLCEAHKNLSSVRSTFISSFSYMKYALAASRALARHQPHEVASLLLPGGFSQPLLAADWMFSPIVELHNQVVSAETSGRNVNTDTRLAISMVTVTLQLVLLLEEWRPTCLRHVTLVARVARLMCVFLTGSDLFLDNTIRGYLTALLHFIVRPSSDPARPFSCLDRLEFGAPVPGLTSFYDLYASVLSHYAAVSFGDSLFARFLVLPLAQRYHPRFRRALWDEHVEALRALSLRPQQLPVPLENYLYPVEQDEQLLSLYLRALATQIVRHQWSPLFFLLAVHHLNSFIFQRVDPEDSSSLSRKLNLLSLVMSVKDESIRHRIVYYYKPNQDSADCCELFSSLPADRQLLLRYRSDPEGCQGLYTKMQSC